MFEIGKYNTLTILRETEPGLYLGQDESSEEVVLLPHKYKPKTYDVNDKIEVFIYLDHMERPVATTLRPLVELNHFAYLHCADVNKFGAFMDWGLEKQLFVPFKEQARPMKVGGRYIVYLYLDDKTNRLVGSSKTNQFLQNEELTVAKFDEVEILVTHITDKGVNVIINGIHKGLIYEGDIFDEIRTGDRRKAYIKKIRKDHKIDVVIQNPGFRSIEPNALNVMEELKVNDGFLPLHDNSSPEEIKKRVGLSKKSFKKAIGLLYKERKITIEKEGIRMRKN